MQKNQKIKASPASLLAPCTSLFASQTRFAQTAMLPVAPFRSFAWRSPDEANPHRPRLRHWFLIQSDLSCSIGFAIRLCWVSGFLIRLYAIVTPHPFGEIPYNRGAFLNPEDTSHVITSPACIWDAKYCVSTTIRRRRCFPCSIGFAIRLCWVSGFLIRICAIVTPHPFGEIPYNRGAFQVLKS